MGDAVLTADSTSEDIQAHVEQVVQEVAEERAGEQKSDAQITSEHAKPAHKEETPAETDSGSDTAPEGEDTAQADTAEVEDRGEDTEPEGQEWLTDEVKTEAAAYGIEESEIADFASREEFDRALRLFDKSALEAGRKAMAEGEDRGDGRTPKGQFAKKEETTKEEPKAEPPREGLYEFKEDIYDEDLEGDLKGFRDHYESRFQALEARLAEADAQAEERHFDNLVDKLGHADLFGKTDQESPKQLQRREDLLVAVKAQQIGLQQLGRPTGLTESLINRVTRMVFADELGKKDLKKRTRKITKQANGRQGGGATRPQDPREDPRDEFDRLYRELGG